jgi:L-amino acid N-acyltransferase YncA
VHLAAQVGHDPGQTGKGLSSKANLGSIRLHRACGFVDIGTLREVGFKFGRWLDTVLMQRSL